MSPNRATQLKERLANLQKLKEAELKLKKPARKYLMDLNFSIEGCERELRFLDKNPHGVEFVNGV